jgi:hypothetical protein
MAKFEFHIDKKCTIWVREYHQFEAENYAQAESIITENFRLSATDNTFTMQDVQHDTLDDMAVKDNNGWPTAELIDIFGNKLADNTILNNG